MSDEALRRRLQSVQPPDELDAERRAWAVVRAAYEAREPVRVFRWPVRPLVAVAALTAVVCAAALTPAGTAVGGWIRDAVVGEKDARPSLDALPAGGRLLVTSSQGPWVVQADGSKRRLGAYVQASWSPSGKFVVATGGHQVVALEPDGDVHWSVSRPQLVTDARWMPGTGFRVAYRSGTTLRVVGGNGENDHLLAVGAAPVAPAWRPAKEHVLAFVGGSRRIRLANADTRKTLWRTPRGPRVTELHWSSDGSRLLAAGPGAIRVYAPRGKLEARLVPPAGAVVLSTAYRPGERSFAFTTFSPKTGSGTAALYDPSRRSSRRLFSGAGRLGNLAWSPDGRWLLVSWPEADQWLFIEMPGVGIDAVRNISAEFDPGGEGRPSYPRIEGWCCSP